MGRNRAFDEQEVTAKAMGAFRHAGFSGLSIKNLEQATGLSSGSLYNSFGDKERIFRAALKLYNNRVVRGRIARHLGGPDPRASLTSLFVSILNEPGGNRDGCLLTNSAIEFGADKSVVGKDLNEGLGLLEAAFAREIHRASGADESEPINQRTYQKALRLLVFYQGVLVMFRSGSARAPLKRAIKSEIETILEGTGND